ncbi:MAG: tyrosine-type recombinase/integrase [Clostridia bacterium]
MSTISKDYFLERDCDNQRKLNELIQNDLPKFCDEFFIGIQNRTTLLTRLNYASDLRLFFGYCFDRIERFKYLSIKDFSFKELNSITAFEIEQYLNYISVYTNNINGNDIIYKNGERGKSRKLSTLRALMNYFYKKECITQNTAAKVDTPKLHEKEIVRLQGDEIEDLLNTVETGNGMSKRQQVYHSKSNLRDVAIVTLLLGTGIRISECVGLNYDDINFKDNSFAITRKGGNRVILYFSEEVAAALMPYIDQRISNKAINLNQKALFLSKDFERLSPRSVQLLIKKYSKVATPLKKITPHKLRSTYGTELYRETGDIYVVADVLGHKDVNTTKKHYAAITDDIRKKASEKVILHKKNLDSNIDETK